MGITMVLREYCEELYSNNDKNIENGAIPNKKEPTFLRAEVLAAIKKLKNGKSPGAGGVTVKVLK